LMMAVYSWQQTKFLLWTHSIGVAIMVGVDALLYKLSDNSNGANYSYIAYVIWLLLMLHTSWRFTKRYGFGKGFLFMFTGPLVMEAVFLLLNDYTIIPSFLANNNTVWRLFVRLIISPLFYSILIVFFRICAKNLHSDRVIIITLLPLFFKAVFGRVFATESATIGILVLNSFLSIVGDLIVRLTLWNRHQIFKYLRLRFSFIAENGIFKHLYEVPDGDIFYGQFLNYEKAHEVIGIIFALGIQLITVVYTETYDGMPPIFYSLLVQLGIELVGQIGISYAEYKFNIPIINTTRHLKEFLPIFIFSTLMGSMFVSRRAYNILTNVE